MGLGGDEESFLFWAFMLSVNLTSLNLGFFFFFCESIKLKIICLPDLSRGDVYFFPSLDHDPGLSL